MADANTTRKRKNADAQALFRQRRTNYINSLEAIVRERDAQLSDLHEILQSTRSEADQLRAAVADREAQWRQLFRTRTGASPGPGEMPDMPTCVTDNSVSSPANTSDELYSPVDGDGLSPSINSRNFDASSQTRNAEVVAQTRDGQPFFEHAYGASSGLYQSYDSSYKQHQMLSSPQLSPSHTSSSTGSLDSLRSPPSSSGSTPNSITTISEPILYPMHQRHHHSSFSTIPMRTPISPSGLYSFEPQSNTESQPKSQSHIPRSSYDSTSHYIPFQYSSSTPPVWSSRPVAVTDTVSIIKAQAFGGIRKSRGR